MKRFFRNLFAYGTLNKIKELEKQFLHDLILAYYPAASIKEKRFYNIGAGDQRSQYNFWTYLDLATSAYPKESIDIFYDLETCHPLPLAQNSAEVIFNSFVIEHISTAATQNLCKEAYRVLKKGGVFHAKVHCYHYGFKLLQKNLPTPQIPFHARETSQMLYHFIAKHRGKITASFNKDLHYIVKSNTNPHERLVFSPIDGFIYHNATAAITPSPSHHANQRLKKLVASTLNSQSSTASLQPFYDKLKQNFINHQKKHPHQHNADYFPKEKLFAYIKKLGFTQVSFLQPYQSMSPALWENSLNPTHFGFLFTIEAIK